MPRAVPLPLREQIVARHQHGQPLIEIAQQLNLSYRTVCHCWQRYHQHAEAGLHNAYERCRTKQREFSQQLQQSALTLKQEHPRWGAQLIRLSLAEHSGPTKLPSVRSLQRWFAQAGLAPVHSLRPPSLRERGQEPHDVWQVDAKERLRLADGTGACVLNVTDEASRAALGAAVFPLYHWGQVPAWQVQQALRALFVEWGRPKRIRVDNGVPWGTWSDLPPGLVLWWIGLEIAPIWNHPHTPKENALVERFNGLVVPWAEPHRCANVADFAARMAWVVQTQREVYPAVGGRSRLACYPKLQVCARPYVASAEASLFAIETVRRYLAEGRWVRLVGKTGQISLYNRVYGAGRAYAGTQVYVRFDATACEWVIQNQDGAQLARHRAVEIAQDRICRLQVSHVKPSRQMRDRQNPVA